MSNNRHNNSLNFKNYMPINNIQYLVSSQISDRHKILDVSFSEHFKNLRHGIYFVP